MWVMKGYVLCEVEKVKLWLFMMLYWEFLCGWWWGEWMIVLDLVNEVEVE